MSPFEHFKEVRATNDMDKDSSMFDVGVNYDIYDEYYTCSICGSFNRDKHKVMTCYRVCRIEEKLNGILNEMGMITL